MDIPPLAENIGVILTAAGESRRLQLGQRKPYLDLGGRAVLLRSLDAFAELEFVHEIVIVVNEKDRKEVLEKWGDELSVRKVSNVIGGGAERQDSVRCGAEALSDKCEWLAIHDGVRPFIRANAIEATIRGAMVTGAAILATPMKETVKQVTGSSPLQGSPMIAATIPRADLWCAQTPQVFPRLQYLDISRRAATEGWEVTDDAQLFEKAGLPVALIEGTYDNIKITTEADYRLAQSMAERWFE